MLLMTANRPLRFMASGFSSPAEDFAMPALDLNKFLLEHPASSFFWRNSVRAYEKYGIFQGDIVLVDRSLKPQKKLLNLVIYENEFKICDFVLMQKLLKKNDIDFEFWGVITVVIRKFLDASNSDIRL
jgi:DNA polymerase V